MRNDQKKLSQKELDKKYEEFISNNGNKLFLFGHDISGLSLQGKDLCEARIHHTKLINTNLSHCDLYNAEIYWSDLTNANLTGANLYGGRISWTHLDLSILDNAFSRNIEFHCNKKCSSNWTIEPNAEFFKSDVSMIGYWNTGKLKIVVRFDSPDDTRGFYCNQYSCVSECKFEFKAMKKVMKCIPSNVKVWPVISAYMRSSSKIWKKAEGF